jgi:hypothetical protein
MYDNCTQARRKMGVRYCKVRVPYMKGNNYHWKADCRPGMMAHTCNPSHLGHWENRGQPEQKVSESSSQQICQTWWCIPVILTTRAKYKLFYKTIKNTEFKGNLSVTFIHCMSGEYTGFCLYLQRLSLGLVTVYLWEGTE